MPFEYQMQCSLQHALMPWTNKNFELSVSAKTATELIFRKRKSVIE